MPHSASGGMRRSTRAHLHCCRWIVAHLHYHGSKECAAEHPFGLIARRAVTGRDPGCTPNLRTLMGALELRPHARQRRGARLPCHRGDFNIVRRLQVEGCGARCV